MDGGGLTLAPDGTAETVWRREGIIYSSSEGKAEKMLGEGRSCSIASVNGKSVYAWTKNGEIVLMKPAGEMIILGKGSAPVISTINNKKLISVWENDAQIHASVTEL